MIGVRGIQHNALIIIEYRCDYQVSQSQNEQKVGLSFTLSPLFPLSLRLVVALYNRCVVSLEPVLTGSKELINLPKALKKAVLFFILNFDYYKPYKCSNFINF